MPIAKEERLFMQAPISSNRKTHIWETVVFGLILIGIVISVLFVALGSKEKATTADITYQGNVVYSFSLNEDRNINLPVGDGTMEIEIKDGKIRVISSPCPYQYCVGQGFVDQAGTSIICAHEGVCILLRGEGAVKEITI